MSFYHSVIGKHTWKTLIRFRGRWAGPFIDPFLIMYCIFTNNKNDKKMLQCTYGIWNVWCESWRTGEGIAEYLSAHLSSWVAAAKGLIMNKYGSLFYVWTGAEVELCTNTSPDAWVYTYELVHLCLVLLLPCRIPDTVRIDPSACRKLPTWDGQITCDSLNHPWNAALWEEYSRAKVIEYFR